MNGRRTYHPNMNNSGLRARAFLLALAALLAFISLPACAKKTEPKAEELKPSGVTEEVLIPSRGALVPATVCVPESEAPVPLAVMIHGFGGTRDSGGGFKRIAEHLLSLGIASVRFDCAGCGESEEPFTEYSISSIKADALSSIAYAEEHYGVDPERIILIGYSMGGRASLELAADGSVSPCAMILFAPAASSEDLKGFMGGEKGWERLYNMALANGSVPFGGDKELGLGFFRDLAVPDPTARAAELFSGPSAVVWAKNDAIVSPAVSENVANALGSLTLTFPNGGHSCGLYGRDHEARLTEIEKLIDRVLGTK